MNYRFKRICWYALPVILILAHAHFFYTHLAASEDQEEQLSSNQITVFNLSDEPIYVATYCKNLFSGNAKRTSEPILISAKKSNVLERLESSMTCSRQLMFSLNAEDLQDSLSKNVGQHIGSVGIGSVTGGILSSKYYITNEDGSLKGYSSLFFKAKNTLSHTKAILQTLYNAELQMALKKSRFYKNNPRDLEVAQVRISDKIPEKEAQFITKRKEINKIALEKFLGKKLNGSYIPTIAFVNSGGGVRALISALGMHIGAEKTGLLDCITYDVGLSGGSWFVSLWQHSQLEPSSFKAMMEPILARGMDPVRPDNFSLPEIQNILDGLMLRKAAQQPVTLVTLWGSMLANRYLSPYAPYSQDILFSELYDRIADAHMPFPILAAVNGRFADLGIDLEKAEWFEFSPLEASGVGNWLGNASIPMWAFGRTFKNNASIDSKPEYDLGQLMGICGSAFAFTMGRAFAETIGNISMQLSYIVSHALGAEMTSLKRLSVGKAPNFTNDVADSIIKDFEDVRLVDAGMSFNIPIPPVLQKKRKADIMIVMDASGSKIGKALEKAELQAKLHNMPFPKITYTTIETKATNIFEDKDPNTPTIIHLSRVADRENITYPELISQDYSTKISTGKFQYSPEQLNQLSGVTEANLVQSIDAIKAAIINKIELNKGFAQ